VTDLLTARQLDVLLAIAEGEVTNEIAADLGISPLTVCSHRKKILFALGARTAAHAVAIAYHEGILQPRRRG
jgi:DNA-binding NarL/FixJ family response regulator